MSKSEIYIDKNELSSSNGNLRQLVGNWESCDRSKTDFNDSKGLAMSEMVRMNKVANDAKSSIKILLYKSIGYFEALGVSFEEADKNAETVIDALATGSEYSSFGR